MLYSNSVIADQCSVVFPGGAGSSTPGSHIDFSCGSQILNNPSHVIPVTSLHNPNGCGVSTCGTANCSASGTTLSALNVGSFKSSSGVGGNVTVTSSQTIGGSNNAISDYNNITVQPSATLNFSAGISNTTYKIQNLTLKNAATVNFQPGDYWIEHVSFQGGQTITFNVIGAGTARIYFANNINVGQTVAWNVAGAANQLFIYNYGGFALSGIASQVHAIIYSQQDITLSRTALTGAVTGADVRLNNNSTITFDGAAVNNTDFGATCPKSNTQFAITANQITPDCQTPGFSGTQTAGNDFTLFLSAYNRNTCAIETSYTGTKTIRFYTSYVNPSSGTMNVKINGSNIASSQAASITTQAVSFVNGVATLTVNYADVGQLQLNAMDNAVAGVVGASGNFVVIPAKFVINVPGNAASQITTPTVAAVAACIADTVFKKAGENFIVHVQPQNAQGNVTPNYGNEAVSEGIVLKSKALVAPNPGRNGSNNNGAIVNGNVFTKITNSTGPFAAAPYFTGSTFSFDEVGCINLSASIASANYLGSGGDVVAAQVVGRFVPDHFDVSGNSPKFGTACSSAAGSFTYLDQPFSYNVAPILSVTARALSGSITQNYTGSFWKLTNLGFATQYQKAYYPVTPGDSIPNLSLINTIPTPVFVDNGNGLGTFSFSDGGGLKIQRQANVLVAPFTAEIQLLINNIKDSDNVACTGSGCVAGGFAFGNTTLGNGIAFSGSGFGSGKQFYHGRLVVLNEIGSEILPLKVPMQTQFYTANNGYLLNNLDSCTVINGGVPSLDLFYSNGFSSTATLDNPPVFQQGVLNIQFAVPNKSGYVDIDPNLSSTGANLPWLQSIWPGITGGSFTGDPYGRATFGIYHIDDQVIYQKEVVH